VLIPSIDLMGGKIVQLVQGDKKALEFDNFGKWVERFSRHPLVQLIDLDAAMGNGGNWPLIAEFCGKLPCQVGGGIRSANNAREVLKAGAKRVILGSSLINDGAVDTLLARSLCEEFGIERLVMAIDSRGGRVAIHGWKTVSAITPEEMMQALEPYCSAFLYTHIDTEGLLQGIPLAVISDLRRRTARRLIAAGGIRCQQEIDALEAMGVDAVVGMAIYSGMIEV
jgi:phosphoribosylformimino-5-aminoimidazole carboxamide ribotide isomerase